MIKSRALHVVSYVCSWLSSTCTMRDMTHTLCLVVYHIQSRQCYLSSDIGCSSSLPFNQAFLFVEVCAARMHIHSTRINIVAVYAVCQLCGLVRYNFMFQCLLFSIQTLKAWTRFCGHGTRTWTKAHTWIKLKCCTQIHMEYTTNGSFMVNRYGSVLMKNAFNNCYLFWAFRLLTMRTFIID